MEIRKSDIDNTCPDSLAWTANFFWTAPSASGARQDICESTQSSSAPNTIHETDATNTVTNRIPTALGEVIRKQRLSLGISQHTLAEEIGLDRGYLISIEHAKRNPSVSTLLQIAAGLHIRASELLRQAEQVLGDKG